MTPIPGANLFPAGHPLFIRTNGKIRLDPRRPASRPKLPITNYEIALYPL